MSEITTTTVLEDFPVYWGNQTSKVAFVMQCAESHYRGRTVLREYIREVPLSDLERRDQKMIARNV